MARRSRVVSTPSTMPRPDRSSVLLPPIRRWCWRISKLTRNPTRYRRRRNCCKSSILKTISSPLTPCIAKKNLRGCRRGAGASDRSIKRQPTDLVPQVEAVCKNAKPRSGVQTVDRKKRNRHETRTVAVFDARPAVAGTEWQPYVAAIVAVERRVLTFQPATGLWKPSRETAFYLSNRSVRAGQAAEAIRKHWGIENKLTYTRDVTLCEDASRIRRNPGISARIRSFAYNILRFNQSDTIAQDRYAAALGGLKSLFAMNFYKER